MEGVRAGLHLLSYLTKTLVLHIGFLFPPLKSYLGSPVEAGVRGVVRCAIQRSGSSGVCYKVQISLDSPRIGALPGFKLG